MEPQEQNQIPQTPVPKPPFNFFETDPKKNFTPWFLMFCGVLILIGLSLAGYFKYKAYESYKLGKSFEKQVEVQDKHSGWKTYRNEEYGFELKMPPDWVVEEVGVDEGKISFTSKERYDFWRKGEFAGDGVSVDMIFDNRDSSKYDYILSTSTTKINGVDFNVYNMAGMYSYDVYRTSNAGKMFSFSVMTEEAYKILSTFKFLNSTTSDIQQYILDNYKDESTITAIKSYVATREKSLKDGLSQQKQVKNIIAEVNLWNCLRYIRSNEEADKIIDNIEKIIINTPDRIAANELYEQALSGTVLPRLIDGGDKTMCNFNAIKFIK